MELTTLYLAAIYIYSLNNNKMVSGR